MIVISFTCFTNLAPAQDRMLLVEGKSPQLFITHKIEPKENYYSIGRMYNVPPKELAPFNNLDFEKGLNLGQAIKVPLTQNNFTQEGAGGNNEKLIPVYHIIEAREGLYRVSLNYNKVSLQQLKKWNNLSSDTVGNGTKLVVGYLKVHSEQSALGKNKPNVEKEVAKETEARVITKTDVPAESVPAVKNTENAVPATDSKAAVSDKKPAANNVPVTRTAGNFNGGRFKNLYEDQARGKTITTESGHSGVFKSTSGWQDGKYYCFHNSAQPGTILKIINTANDRSVYAKVLDLIPDINKNAGLILHISNSAAEDLGVTGTRFHCTVNYYK